MSWKRVDVIAQVGTEFGIVSDMNGYLTIVVKRPDEDWPHGVLAADLSGQNKIEDGYTRFCALET